MFEVKYKTRILLDGFKAQDVVKSFKCKRIEFHAGIAYCYRSKFAYMAISEDDVIEFNDLVQNVYIDVHDSFKAQELAYCLPF